MSDIDPNSDPPELTMADSKTKFLWLGSGFPIIVIIWLVYYGYQSPLDKDISFDRLNTLFSGLAFWGVVFAILLQKSELQLQRDELRLTRNELKLTRSEVRGQKEQLEAQNATLKQQRFENTFFSLVNLFNSIVASMEVRTNTAHERPGIFNGRECFIPLYNDLQREYSSQENQTPKVNPLQLCLAAYERFAGYRQEAVGHYFRTFYNIVKFIDKSQIEDKQTYINILRAQLSSSELYLLFYNCLSTYGSEKFKPYVEHFGLLENMTISNLIRRGHKDLYNESAFRSPV